MKNKTTSNVKHSIIRFCLMAIITLLLLIPLAMVEFLIEERSENMKKVSDDIATVYAKEQIVSPPTILPVNKVTSSYSLGCSEVNYAITVDTKKLHRSLYDVIVYNTKINISGDFKITPEIVNATRNNFVIDISDLNGLVSYPTLSFGGETYAMVEVDYKLRTDIKLPKGAHVGDRVNFNLSLDLNGMKSLKFKTRANVATLNMKSNHPHPSFKGSELPSCRDVRPDGFDATWNISNQNFSRQRYADVKIEFVDPANPYQQATRSAKYGILIIVFVFVAGLLAEFISGKEINLVQYAIIGLSLVLFYSLLLAFSEIILFCWAYAVAATMTTSALTLYFRGILKSRSGYILGGFVSLVYVMNYIILQMETYALLAGSLALFVLLSTVMYLTANIDKHEEPTMPTCDKKL